MSVEFIITTNTKKITTRCVPWYIYFLPERKIVDLSGIIFQIFLKWKRTLSKKMISHFIKNRNWVALTPPKQHGIIHIYKKNLEKLFPPHNNNIWILASPSPDPILLHIYCVQNLFLTSSFNFFSIGWFLYTTY